MSIEVGLNVVYIRSLDQPFAVGVERAAQTGYRYVEPLVHSGWEILIGGGHYHSFSMTNGPLEMKDILDRHDIEPRQVITSRTEGLPRMATLLKSPFLGVNYDTGNAHLGGEDPYEGLNAVRDLLVHLHATDIAVQQSNSERGKVTGTPVGCACRDRVIDWARVISILRGRDFKLVLSVECGIEAQAVRSLAHLQSLIRQNEVTTYAQEA